MKPTIIQSAKPTELAWIRRRLLQLKPQVESLALVHLVTGQDSTQLGLWQVDRNAQVEDEAQRLSSEVQEATLAHSEAFAGATQSYAVIAYTEADRVAGQLTFRRHVPGDGVADTPSDPPTASGALAQTMRQTEMFARILLSTINSTVQSLAAENERLAQRAERADAQTIEVLGLIQELSDRKATIQLEQQKQTINEARKDRLLRTIERTAIPLLEEKLSTMGPMKRLVDSMQGEQVEKLLASGIFTPEQLGAFGELMKANAQADKAREQREAEREREQKEEENAKP